MKKTRNNKTKAERRQGIANLTARGILRMKEANVLLSPQLARAFDTTFEHNKPPISPSNGWQMKKPRHQDPGAKLFNHYVTSIRRGSDR